MTWQNWAGTATADPARRYWPRSTQEIADAIKDAAAAGLTVRALGSGHSFTPAAATSGAALDLSWWAGVISADAESGLVTVRSGTTIRQLNAALDVLGLAMPNLGDIDAQTIAGAISTGTHGTGARLGGIATAVAALELVLADGSVVSCSPQQRPDLFAAAQVSVGALGVISTVTLQCVPAFDLDADERPMPLGEVLERFGEFAASNDHFEFYWFPYGKNALVKRNNRGTELPRMPAWRQFFEYEVMENAAFGGLCRTGRAVPALIKPFNRFAASTLSKRSYSAPSHQVFVTPRRVRFVESEYAVPRESLLEVLSELRAAVPRLADPVMFPVEVRVAAADDIWLSTAYGRDTAYVAIHQYVGLPYQEYFRALESITAAVGGRPHWGKMHTRDAAQLAELYPRFGDFLRVRDEVDPGRSFANPYLEQVFGSLRTVLEDHAVVARKSGSYLLDACSASSVEHELSRSGRSAVNVDEGNFLTHGVEVPTVRDSADWTGTPLCLLPAYRITDIPRRGDGAAAEAGQRAETSDPGRPQRVAALVAAYHAGTAGGTAAGGAVAFGWVRTAAGGPVHVVAAGDALAGSPLTGADVLLSLPGGARAAVLPPGELAGLLRGLPAWREIAGISDGLLAPADERSHGGQASGHGTLTLDEGLLGSWSGPFGWIVIAEPLRPAQLRSLAGEVGRRQRLAEGAADRFPERAVEARRLRERHAEVERGASTGFWRIRVLAGGCDAASAARVAGLFCASAGLEGLPYALSPVSPDDRDKEQADEPGGDATPASPFCGSTELVAALARPPECEIPGIRLALRPDFDVTPETQKDAAQHGGLPLGEVLDRNMMPAGAFTLSRDSLNRHVFVCGATGAGKSQTVRSLLEAATGQRIPWLVIEPAKAEYRLMASRLPDAEGARVIRIRPGEPDAVAAGLNPLEPAADASGNTFPLQTHADLVRALFIAAFRSEEPFPQVLSAALTRVYEDAGWDLALGEPRKGVALYPTLTALQRAAERVVTEIGYSQRITDDVLGFIRVRLASLRLGTTGRFLEGGHPIDFGALLRKNVVLEIEDVGDDADKAFLMGAVLIRLAEHLRLAHRTGPAVAGLRHLTVVEEAHRLLRRPEPAEQSGAGAAGHAVEMFAGLLAEIRAYGEGLVIAEQIPARLVQDAIKNTAVKITHRLPAADDRDAVGATMNATPSQSRFLVTLAPGEAAVFSDGMDFPVLVKMKDGSEREMATAGATLDARTVVTPRSATCGAECAARPCTLRDMRAAQRALDDYPWVRLWAELAVLAHLTGWPTPVPKPAVLARYRQLTPRVSQCATAHAVDAAVAARSAVPNPGTLARHVQAVIRARADRDQWLCPADEPEWLLAGPVTEAVAFGVARPSAIESTGPLSPLLGEFIDCRWPLQYLSRSTN